MMPHVYEPIIKKLLKGQPKGKKIGRLINGRFKTGIMSLHRTRQSRLFQLFWRMKQRRRTIVL